MIGIVVSGHINFATGMQSAVKAITGEQEQMAYVDFVESMSTDQLEDKLRQAVKEVDSGEGVLILADLPGGSPSNRASTILMESQNVELIAGANLPMIANAAFERDGANLQELVEVILEIGTSCIQNMRLELEKMMVSEPELESEDGL
ncbi:PTS galactosamine/N-acetylgalactosamine transporter subunit IIA [Psychromonas hadalis]|uniref:PTS galactosamine/N-acetylgalactosamine transporter subunit IIA n=1 Tax=Psychromonas hadalis TaxID=211669 RepID=UPI0003B4BA3D|nr:PTS galactosamine/N-acetylgalactosamine transporter subunit IIA [Psychromonas hadalis]